MIDKIPLTALAHKHRDTIRQFFWFAVGGVIGFGVDCGVLTLVQHLPGFNLYSARIVSYLCAVTATFIFSRLVAFRAAEPRPLARQWSAFAIVNLGGFILNYGTYTLLIAYVPFVHAWYGLGVAAGSFAGLVFNFPASRFLVFKMKKG